MSTIVHRFARTAADLNQPPPAVNVRFFYTSPLPIDDPLSPVPPPLTSISPSSRLPPRPFSEYDNTALDKAWNKLRKSILKYREETDAEKTAEASLERERKGSARSVEKSRQSPIHTAGTSPAGVTSAGETPTPPSRWAIGGKASPGNTRLQDIGSRDELGQASSPPTRLRSSSLRSSLAVLDPPSREETGALSDGGPQGLTGMPFARAPSRRKVPTVPASLRNSWSGPVDGSHKLGGDDGIEGTEDEDVSESGRVVISGPTEKVPVGISRLHQVAMPGLQMEPIYWLPVHDIATVIRGTWFYRNSMLPVEVDVANMLEAGYMALRPWTDTWSDELNSAADAGALGEEKIQHMLWPEPAVVTPGSRPGTSSSTRPTLDETSPEERRQEIVQIACDLIDVAISKDGADTKASGKTTFGRDGQERAYVGSSVIYVNGQEAYILRPNLQPSAYYGRRPFANYIRKDRGIGVPVVRGFDQAVWDKLNPSKTGKTATAAREGVSSSAGPGGYRRMQSDPNLAKARNPQVTDLILVIHGIGQKLSERVESYHFTHAMNSFRREVNVELGTSSVKAHLRQDMGGIMVLPVNWRAALSFEEGGYRDGPEDPSGNQNQYTLKDITPESLPSVRNIISDVMLDIPYYLSHHQPTMLSAVIREANRVHRLWCQNNPGFERYGRIHLMAHSLGSVMALDILSKQPTEVEPQSNVQDDPQHFRFDTKNLYLCGSPAGFFLLLQKATLLPRRSRKKSSASGADTSPGVAGEQGTYGCLSVDNIYNVVNPYDPVAYRINATVDATYAASLKPAFIPSASSSWFSFGGSTFRGAASSAAAAVTTKPMLTQRLPSNVELETHNFTREEVAENRFYLLNDNGQIDFFLRYGGGPLEIQYLTMLGAHSSYWISKDFVRFVVMETGRKLGREGTLNAIRAVKRKGAFVGP